jgi:hypothetical protein
MDNGSEAVCKSTTLLAAPFSGRPWMKVRFQKKAMLAAVAAFMPRKGVLTS